jgi:hypothetical protein
LDVAPHFYLDRQRETWNSASIALSRNLTKKSTVTASLSSEIVRYRATDFSNQNRFFADLGMGYQINKWLNFNARYTHYLNNVDARFRGNNIENLQIAGFSVQIARGWILSSSGGIATTKAGGTRWVTGTGQAGITKTSEKTTIGLNYQRGYFTIFGTSQVWYGDTANLYLIHSLSRRINIHASAAYLGGSSLGVGSFLTNSVYGATGLDVALRNNLVVATNYSLVSQKLPNGTLSSVGLHRSIANIGLRYYLPSLAPR